MKKSLFSILLLSVALNAAERPKNPYDIDNIKEALAKRGVKVLNREEALAQIRSDIAVKGLDKGKEALAERAAIFAATTISTGAEYQDKHSRALELSDLRKIGGMLSRKESYEFEAILAKMKQFEDQSSK